MCLLNSPHKKVMASGRERKPDMFCMYLFCFIFVFVFTGFCIFLSLGPDVFAKFPAQEGDGIWRREEARQVFLRKVLAQDVGSSTNQQPATVDD